jgi:hypothetical protein
MRLIATPFLNREATLILKGNERVRRWIAAVQEDRIITYPVDAKHRPGSSTERAGREPYRYSQLIGIIEPGGSTPSGS